MVLERVKKNKNMGYEPVGFLDDDKAKLGRTIEGIKVLGKLSEIERLVKEKRCGRCGYCYARGFSGKAFRGGESL